MIARTESTLAFSTVVVGSLQTQRPQHTFEGLLVAAMILRHRPTGTGQFRPGVIGSVRVQSLFQCSRSQP